MAPGEELTSIDELLSRPSERPHARPAGPLLFLGCLFAAVIALASLTRVIYLFFPLPWDFVMWLFGG